jgi:hypothetical protein
VANRSYKHAAELDNRERRLIVLARFRQERRTLQDYADETGVSKTTAISDKKIFMERLHGDVDSEIHIYRQCQLAELNELRAQLKSPSIKDDRKIELALSILDREADLLGTWAPAKSITAHVDAAQLDPLYLDIRGVLQDLEEDDQQMALGLLREFAATKVKPITIDSKQLEAHNEADTKLS